jgi:hypothetical protein
MLVELDTRHIIAISSWLNSGGWVYMPGSPCGRAELYFRVFVIRLLAKLNN